MLELACAHIREDWIVPIDNQICSEVGGNQHATRRKMGFIGIHTVPSLYNRGVDESAPVSVRGFASSGF
jgi:hypothetical protein